MKYMILLFLSASCFAAEPKFHYGDCVKVTRGFYAGSSGVIDQYRDTTSEYTVHISKVSSGMYLDEYEWINESELSLSKGCR